MARFQTRLYSIPGKAWRQEQKLAALVAGQTGILTIPISALSQDDTGKLFVITTSYARGR
jgi:hypothetical protein